MTSHQLGAAARAARRILPAFGLAATLLTSTLGPPPSPAAAQAPPQPAARQQIVVKEFKIHDDREGFLSGAGEMGFVVGIWRCDEGVPPPCSIGPDDSMNVFPGNEGGVAAPIVRASGIFNASTGDTVSINREVPAVGDVMWGGTTAPELGFAVYPGYQYVVQFEMEEMDDGCASNCDEYMGQVLQFVDIRGEQGLGMGTHTVRSVGEDGVSPGDFTVTYEMRAMPFPDIEPLRIQVSDLPGRAEKRVCMTVMNWGPGNASPFEVALKVNGVVPPDGRYPVSVLAAKNEYLTCVVTALPAGGQYRLEAVADERRTLTEYDESNNVYEQAYTAPARPVAATEPGPTPSPEQADLSIASIKVNGQAPDGKDDCKAGKSSVAVVVKNESAAKADTVTVRLAVDGVEVGAQSLTSLEPGKEREVRFADVSLKKGEHKLAAAADLKDPVADTRQGDHELKIVARCQDGD